MFLRRRDAPRSLTARAASSSSGASALDPLLAARRPRPRWRAPMIEHQQLRWFRTTLLGRTPGWSPPAAAVGPWRPVRVERRVGIAVEDVRLRALAARREAGVSRSRAGCARSARHRSRASSSSSSAAARAPRAALARPLATTASSASGGARAPAVERWWPHTHGEPALLRRAPRVVARDAGEPSSHRRAGAIGFRERRATSDPFALRLNGAPDLLPRRLLDAARRRQPGR